MRDTSFGRLPGRMATVGAEGDNPRSVRNGSRGADGFARSTSGWPTNSTGTPAFAIDRLLERKDHEHAIRDRADRLQPSRAPRPDLRADVVDDRDAEALDRRRQAEIEIGKVDEDQRVRPLGARGRDERRRAANDRGSFAIASGQAGDREVAVVVDEPAAGGRELRAAEAGDGERRIEREQLARQRAGVQVAGRLAARQQQARSRSRAFEQRGSRSMLTLTSVMRRSTDCAPIVRVAWKAIWIPSTAR